MWHLASVSMCEQVETLVGSTWEHVRERVKGKPGRFPLQVTDERQRRGDGSWARSDPLPVTCIRSLPVTPIDTDAKVDR